MRRLGDLARHDVEIVAVAPDDDRIPKRSFDHETGFPVGRDRGVVGCDDGELQPPDPGLLGPGHGVTQERRAQASPTMRAVHAEGDLDRSIKRGMQVITAQHEPDDGGVLFGNEDPGPIGRCVPAERCLEEWNPVYRVDRRDEKEFVLFTQPVLQFNDG